MMPITGPVCPYCKSASVLVDGSQVYGESYRDRLSLWVCSQYPDCDSYVGCQRESFAAAPLGTMANAHLRKLRMMVHKEFDAKWKAGPRRGIETRRRRAYSELADKLKIPIGDCQIARLNDEQCLAVLSLLGGRISVAGS